MVLLVLIFLKFLYKVLMIFLNKFQKKLILIKILNISFFILVLLIVEIKLVLKNMLQIIKLFFALIKKIISVLENRLKIVKV